MNKQRVDLTGSKVLVVDDVPENLDVLLGTLENMEYEAMVATDGAKALSAAKNGRPDIILLDIMMPVMDGYETCRRLKADEELADIPVIFLTARDAIEDVVDGFDLGAADYIVKPFRQKEVLARIRTHLERSRFAKELAELNALLEQKVVERTHQLQMKVRELEGRDRIARYMLTFNSLDEALDLVLAVIGDIVSMDRAVLLLDEEGRSKPKAAIGGEAAVDAQLESALDEVRRSGSPVSRASDGGTLTVVPILREGSQLGHIAIYREAEAPAITEDEMRTLESFALEAAGAINDAQIRQDPEQWKDQLDDILDVDESVDGDEILDRLREG